MGKRSVVGIGGSVSTHVNGGIKKGSKQFQGMHRVEADGFHPEEP